MWSTWRCDVMHPSVLQDEDDGVLYPIVDRVVVESHD
jgi:hypothetical protein